jgi:hypothetical protein
MEAQVGPGAVSTVPTFLDNAEGRQAFAASADSPASPGPGVACERLSSSSKSSPSSWIVSPLFDLLFLANLGWLLVLVPGFVAADGTVPLEFWQVYFLVTPHRWITLILVAADPDRRGGRTTTFVLIALVALVIVWGTKWVTGAFLCLAVLDYVWNGWHFAAQHAGVLRIYARKAGGGHPFLERHGVRLFLVYTILRTAGWATGWIVPGSTAAMALAVADWLALGLAALLLLAELRDPADGRLPKRTYLASVLTLYVLLLLAIRHNWGVLLLALTFASAAFHAVEYLAIVTHYAWRRQTTGSAGLFRRMATRWLTFMIAYIVILGLLEATLYSTIREWWAGLNLWAAFVHYSYDGMIWKLRRPETARVLGVEAAR